MSNTLVRTQQQPAVKKPADIRSYIQSETVKKQIAMVLPKHLTADFMARVVCTAILKTPKLAECRIESLLQAVMLLSQFGMLPDGRSAHLIPFWNKNADDKRGAYDCQAVIDWKGKVARATQNGVENINADVVCHNDKFTWSTTMDGLKFEHERDWKNPDRGEMFAAYCVWRNAGKFSGVIMSKPEIDAIRSRSKSPDKGPWVTDFDEMAKKTVVHRASKLWPLDAKFREAIDAQEAAAPVIDLPELPKVEDEPAALPAPEPTPAAEETIAQAGLRITREAEVTFDDFRSFIATKQLAKDSDSWASFDEVPAVVWETLHGQSKTFGELLRKFGKGQGK